MDCTSCGATNDAAARFCSTCGAALARSELLEHRKTVTVVFCDLVDSTRLAQSIDAEQLGSVLGRYFSAMRGAIEWHEGTVEKFIGDAVVGVFGVPIVHEDDALRAVRAALDMQTATDRLSDELHREFGLRIGTRIGVNTGEVAVGVAREGGLAFGQPMNLAARLQQAAQQGEILIGPETERLVRGAIETDPVRPVAVKGVGTPVDTWRVLRTATVTPRGWQSGGPFVGREPDLVAIEGELDRAINERQAALMTIVAPPGVGKSRLAAEAAGRLASRARVVVGRCVPYGDGVAYQPLVEVVGQLEVDVEVPGIQAALAGTSDGETVLARVRATASGVADGSPDETAWAFRRLFEALADERPLLLVVEDIHWAEPEFLDLIEYVTTFSVGHPILVLCLARPDLLEERQAWAAPRANASIRRLAPLEAADADRLLADLASDLDDDLRRQIVETSGGVPLFVEQMAALGNEARSPDGSEQPLAVPATVRALLAARIDALGEAERIVLEAASIAGEVFERAALVELTPAPIRDTMGSHLMSLTRREFIRPERSVTGRDALRFSHVLIRDAVHLGMSRRLRADLHERFAGLLERGSNPDAARDSIAFHLEAAWDERRRLGAADDALEGLALRTGDALVAAGRRAVARTEPRRAADLLTRATNLLVRTPERRVQLLPELIAALVAAEDYGAAERVHGEAIAEARRLDDRTSALRAAVAWAAADGLRDIDGWRERGHARALEAIDYFAGRGDNLNLAQAWLLRARTEILTPARMIESLREAQAHALLAGDERTQGEVWDDLGGAMIVGPTPYPEIAEVARNEVDWGRERGIVFAEADGSLGEAYAQAALGQFDTARAILDRIRSLFAALPGRTSQYGETWALAGQVERDAGDPEGALEKFARAMEFFWDIGNPTWWRGAAVMRAQTLLDVDRVDEAQGVLDQIATMSFTPYARTDSNELGVRARIAALRGDVRAAVALAREGVGVIAGSGSPQAEGRARELLGNLVLAQGDEVDALVELRLAHDLYSTKAYRPGERRVAALLDSLDGGDKRTPADSRTAGRRDRAGGTGVG